MPDWPGQVQPPLTVWTCDKHGLGVGTRSTAGGTNSALSSFAWGTANLALYIPFVLPYQYPIRNLFAYNGATLNGTTDIGIYDEDLTKVVSSGPTTQATATGLQFFAVNYILDPGAYYFALLNSGTTATYFGATMGNATRARYFGLLQQAVGASTLPDRITPAAYAQTRTPGIGMTWMSGTPSF